MRPLLIKKFCVFARIGPLDLCVLNDKTACAGAELGVLTRGPILTARRIHRFAAAVAAVPTSSSSVGMEPGKPWTDKV